MKRLLAIVTGSVLLMSGVLVGAPPASAAPSASCSVGSGPFTVGDSVTVTWNFSDVPTGGQAIVSVTAPTGIQPITKLYDPGTSPDPAAGSDSFNALWAGTYTIDCKAFDDQGNSYASPGAVPGSFTVSPPLPASVVSCSAKLVGDTAEVSWQTQGNGFTGFFVGIVNGVDPNADVNAGANDRTATVSLAAEHAGLLTIAVSPDGPAPAVDPKIVGCTPDLQYSPAVAVPPVVTLGVSQVNGSGTRAVRQQQLNISWSEPPMVGWKLRNAAGIRGILSNETSIWVDCGFIGDFIAVSQTVGDSAPVRIDAPCAPVTASLALTPLDAHSVQGTFTFTPDLSVVQDVRYWTLIDGQPGPTIRATAPPGPGNTMTFVIPGLPAGKDVTVLSLIGVVGFPLTVAPRATTTMPAAGAALQYQNTTVATGTAFSVPPTVRPQGTSFSVSSVPSMPLTVDAGGTVRGTAPSVTQTTVYTVTVTSTKPAETATFTVTVTPVAGASAALAAAAATGSGTATSSVAATGGIAGTGPVGGSTGRGGASSGSAGAGLAPAPCLAADGSIYPDLSGSVGSTLTMAPNLTNQRPATNFSIVSGALPQGLWLDGDVGVVSGTPLFSNGGWGPVTVRVTFADGTTTDSAFNIAVDDPHHSANYPNRIIGSIGEEVVVAPLEVHTQGTTTFRIVCGSLPEGLKFEPETGEISGTPTALIERPVPLRVRMTDDYGWVDTSFIIVVNQGVTPWLRYPDYAQLDRNVATIIDPTRSGLPGDTRYTLTGRLPKGLTFDKVTGAIYGKPAVAVGTVFRPTVRAFDKNGNVVASTWVNVAVTKPAVPMKVTARRAAHQLAAGRTTIVASVKHPSFARLSAKVTCTGCTHTFNKRTGRLVVTVKKGAKTVRVHIAAVPVGAANRAAYSAHVWTRVWHVRP